VTRDDVSALVYGSDGGLWIGSSHQGMARLDPLTRQISYLPLPDMVIDALHNDPDGTIWIGTGHHGLLRLDPHTKGYSTLTITDGLPSPGVYSITIDPRTTPRTLWVAGYGYVASYQK
jgi:ligand-binding sensor domain-containing protein